MSQSRPAGSGQPRDDARDGGLTGASLFALVWESLADVLGTAATATLVRRAARRADLAELAVVRDNLEYRYTLPVSWNGGGSGDLSALRKLMGELRPLLVEMTGQVVVHQLERIPELREHGIIAPQEEQT